MALMRGIRGYAAIALFAGLALLAPAAASAAPGSISGTVTAADGGAALAGISVCPYLLADEEFEEVCTETEGAGKYTLAGLEPGDYKVEFWDESLGHLGEYYDNQEFWSKAEVLTVGDGAAVTGIDAALDKPAQVSGVVKAAGSGLPIEEVEVCIWGTEFFNCDETGADGKYSFGFLWPDAYEVEFWPFTEANYAGQWWDHRDRWYEADSLELAAAEVQTEIDADLALAGQIKGTVVAASSGAPLSEIRVCSVEIPSEQLFNCTFTSPSGGYTLRRLSTGTYKVVFSPDLAEWFPEELESEDDGYRTQFWNNQPTLSAANPVGVVVPATVSGVDARLATTAIVPPPPPVTPPATKKPAVKKKKCPKGKKLKKVKGKKKCVKVRKKGKRGKGKRAGSARGSALELPGRVRLRT